MAKPLLPGETVCNADGFIKGHGTTVRDGLIVSAVYGHYQQTNKLITVSPCFQFKYSPEVGNVVIGRVIQIANKKWKLDTHSRTETSLALSAITLPGLLQRRKLESDEINMRSFFDKDDLVVCEVQKVTKSGSAALHTRNEKYRKLADGVLLVLPPFRLPPLKTRFLQKNSIELIAGANGFLWISTVSKEPADLDRVGSIYRAIRQDRSHRVDVAAILDRHA